MYQPITVIQRDIINRLPRQTFDLANSPLGEIMVETHDGQFVKRLHYAAMEARAKLAEARIEKLERGEYICMKCGLRKDSDYPKADF